MATHTAINTMYPNDLLKQLDEYGRRLMPDSYNTATCRGRSAVVRRLVALGLAAENRKIKAARRRKRR